MAVKKEKYETSAVLSCSTLVHCTVQYLQIDSDVNTGRLILTAVPNFRLRIGAYIGVSIISWQTYNLARCSKPQPQTPAYQSQDSSGSSVDGSQ